MLIHIAFSHLYFTFLYFTICIYCAVLFYIFFQETIILGLSLQFYSKYYEYYNSIMQETVSVSL